MMVDFPFTAEQVNFTQNHKILSIEKRAQETSTSSLLIWQNGKNMLSYNVEKKMPLYSLTKSMVSIAIGFLYDDKKIESLDTPASRWIVEWQDTPKERVTLRMLLTHTSGIEDHFIEMDGSFNKNKFDDFQEVQDVNKLALSLELVKDPGTHPSYSNSSADILVELVYRISSVRIDRYLEEKLFGPLGIRDWKWVSSTNQLFGTPDDKPSGADGLMLSAQDLQKIGQMLLEKRLLSARWIEMMTGDIPTPHLSLPFAKPNEHYSSALFWLVSPDKSAFMGWGFLGQYLIVVPAKKIVAVRLYHEGLPDIMQVKHNDRVGFSDFEQLIRGI